MHRRGRRAVEVPAAAAGLLVMCAAGCGTPAPTTSTPVITSTPVVTSTPGSTSTVSATPSPPGATLTLTSPDLASGTIAPELTCDGGDRPPQVSWGPLPAGAGAVAVDLYDPDAPGTVFNHWLLVSDQPDPHGQAITSATPAGFTVGTDDFGVAGYRGPCPPPGEPHRYHLRVRVLAAPLHLPDGFDAAALRQAIGATSVIESAELKATYARR